MPSYLELVILPLHNLVRSGFGALVGVHCFGILAWGIGGGGGGSVVGIQSV